MRQASHSTQWAASTTFSTMIARYRWCSANRMTSHMVARDRSAASSGRVSPNMSGVDR